MATFVWNIGFSSRSIKIQKQTKKEANVSEENLYQNQIWIAKEKVKHSIAIGVQVKIRKCVIIICGFFLEVVQSKACQRKTLPKMGLLETICQQTGRYFSKVFFPYCHCF